MHVRERVLTWLYIQDPHSQAYSSYINSFIQYTIYVTGFGEPEGSGLKFGEPQKKFEIRSSSPNLKFEPQVELE